MNVHVPETMSNRNTNHPPAGRRHHGPDDTLILSELNPETVLDQTDPHGEPLNLVTFGNVREACPKCQRHHLKLVLRQGHVRMAHLFCADCQSCFDARYPDGASALTI